MFIKSERIILSRISHMNILKVTSTLYFNMSTKTLKVLHFVLKNAFELFENEFDQYFLFKLGYLLIAHTFLLFINHLALQIIIEKLLYKVN